MLIVGRNPARTYEASALSHKRHLDALFNRNGQSCRDLYDELVDPSPTRRNIDMLRGLLKNGGVDRVLETNVICYSSPMSADLHARDMPAGLPRQGGFQARFAEGSKCACKRHAGRHDDHPPAQPSAAGLESLAALGAR